VRFERVPLMCDNTSAISVVKNSVFHKKMRHIERRHHFLRDHIKKGDIKMRYIDTERQLVDIIYFAFLLHLLHTHLSHLASPVILACICLIMLISVLG
jgi:hypothetical protein